MSGAEYHPLDSRPPVFAVPHTLLIADLHLGPEHPEVFSAFRTFLAETAARAQALYILGDLFEAWAGDDDIDDAFNRLAVEALAKLSAAGTKLYLMHGNRDFLMGQELADACGATLLADPAMAVIHGTPTLLMHGDTLCSSDKDYMAFRAMVRAADWQRDFLAQSLPQRKVLIGQLRARSRQEQSRKSDEIMDVDAETVENILREHGYPRLIHGHTHRPASHRHEVDGRICERWVLPDWYGQGGYLRCDATGCHAAKLPANR